MLNHSHYMLRASGHGLFTSTSTLFKKHLIWESDKKLLPKQVFPWSLRCCQRLWLGPHFWSTSRLLPSLPSQSLVPRSCTQPLQTATPGKPLFSLLSVLSKTPLGHLNYGYSHVYHVQNLSWRNIVELTKSGTRSKIRHHQRGLQKTSSVPLHICFFE